MKTHNQLDAAREQIHDAIDLYFSGRYYSATTLAGASEEVLGKMVEDRGDKNALGSLTSAVDALSLEPSPRKETVRMINEVRDWLKHRRVQESEWRFDASEAASEMIDRSLTNYFQLTGDETMAMARFRKSQPGPNPPLSR